MGSQVLSEEPDMKGIMLIEQYKKGTILSQIFMMVIIIQPDE